jgi:AAA-like domain
MIAWHRELEEAAAAGDEAPAPPHPEGPQVMLIYRPKAPAGARLAGLLSSALQKGGHQVQTHASCRFNDAWQRQVAADLQQADAARDVRTAIARRDPIVLLKGARQAGKTSLLARGLQMAREAGVQMLLTDFQRLIDSQLVSLESFFLAIGEMLADQLGLEIYPEDRWRKGRAPNLNFDAYFRREILSKTERPLLWAIDEVDRLFLCDFSSELFALLRTWHNERALDPDSPCSRLSLATAYATETYHL